MRAGQCLIDDSSNGEGDGGVESRAVHIIWHVPPHARLAPIMALRLLPRDLRRKRRQRARLSEKYAVSRMGDGPGPCQR
jgi:hypothetical protein